MSFQFIFVCKLECSISEDYTRKLIFNISIDSKIQEGLDRPDGFWSLFNVQDKNLKKQVGFYEIETIDNRNMTTFPVNLKEFFVKYKNENINKKHKGLKRYDGEV